MLEPAARKLDGRCDALVSLENDLATLAGVLEESIDGLAAAARGEVLRDQLLVVGRRASGLAHRSAHQTVHNHMRVLGNDNIDCGSSAADAKAFVQLLCGLLTGRQRNIAGSSSVRGARRRVGPGGRRTVITVHTVGVNRDNDGL